MAEAITIGAAEIKLLLEDSSFRAAIRSAIKEDESLRKSVKLTDEDIKSIGTTMTVAGGAIVAGLGFAAKAAADSEQVYGLLAQTVENTGKSWSSVSGQVSDFAGKMMDLTRFGDEDTASMLQKLTGLTGNFDVAMSHAEDVMDLAVGTQMDLQNAAQLYGRILQGDVTMLTRYGINIEAMTGKKLEDMSATERTAVAVDVLRKKYGGLAEKEGKSAIGAMNRMVNLLGEISEAIGGKVLPKLEPFLRYIGDIAKGIVKWIEEHDQLATVLTLSAGAIGVLLAGLGPLLYMIPNLVSGIGLASRAFSALAGVLAANPIVLILAGIIAAVGAFYLAYKTNFLGVRDITGQVIDGIGATFDVFKEYIGKFINNIANIIDEARLYLIKGNKLVMELFGEDTSKIEAQITTIEGNISARTQENADKQIKTWREYYDERQDEREKNNLLEAAKIKEVTELEIESVNQISLARSGTNKLEEQEKKAIAEQEQNRIDLMNEIVLEEAGIFEEQKTAREQYYDAVEETLKASTANQLTTIAEWASKAGMSIDEYRTKMIEVIGKVEAGQTESLTKQELEMIEHIRVMTDDEHFGQLPKKSGNIFSNVKIDWDRHLDSMADATANMIMNSDMDFRTLKGFVTSVFDDIKNTIIGNFRQILAEYVSGFIKNMILATKNDLAGGLTGALGDAFGSLIGGLKGAIGSLVGAITGGGGAVATAAGTATAGGAAAGGGTAAGGITGGVTGAGLLAGAVSAVGVAAPIVAVIDAMQRSRGAWHDLTPEQRAAAIAAREASGTAFYEQSGGDVMMALRESLTQKYGAAEAARIMDVSVSFGNGAISINNTDNASEIVDMITNEIAQRVGRQIAVMRN